MPRWMRLQSSVLTKWLPPVSMRFLRMPQVLKGTVGMLLGMLLVGGIAFVLGRSIGLGAIGAQQPGLANLPAGGLDPNTNANLYPDDYSQRVVAYIYGNVPVTRLELAEYLIARFGSERLEFLVNRKIVEKACQARGINVTDTEIELQFRKDCAAIGPHCTPKMFYEQVLKKYNKTIYEWKEDVIRPKLALQKMIENEVIVIPDTELYKGFELRYGPKAQCRMIVYPDVSKARTAWQKMREAPSLAAAFQSEAVNQFIPDLRPEGGRVPPIHKHFGSPQIEQAAFALKPGEISQVIEMPDHQAIILMCDNQLPADPSKSFDQERLKLHKDMLEEKKTQMMQERIVQLRREAGARFLLNRQPGTDQIIRDAREEIEGGELNLKKVP